MQPLQIMCNYAQSGYAQIHQLFGCLIEYYANYIQHYANLSLSNMQYLQIYQFHAFSVAFVNDIQLYGVRPKMPKM